MTWFCYCQLFCCDSSCWCWTNLFECLWAQDARLSRLQTTLDDACVAQRRALQDKEQTEAELRDSQQHIRVWCHWLLLYINLRHLRSRCWRLYVLHVSVHASIRASVRIYSRYLQYLFMDIRQIFAIDASCGQKSNAKVILAWRRRPALNAAIEFSFLYSPRKLRSKIQKFR